ncbi:type I restriction enzyme HsdR N-terminal domain-containing protein [bacterium AH-315-B15]|nr:type I restriction enzyme HsdR N-terminal domain-containing protein [bacterium AH-315-B15]
MDYFYSMHPKLNLPDSEIKVQDDQIWDRLRKKYVQHTPEEWVRQHFINYLIDHLKYSEALMLSEYTVEYNKMKKRCDIVVMNPNQVAQIIVECKAPQVELSEDTFYQIARYNYVLKAPILILTNGMQHFCALIKGSELKFLINIPGKEEFEEIID